MPTPNETLAALAAKIAALEAENAKLKTANASTKGQLTLKVSEKGAISIYGMGRFPLTVYREQAERLFNQEFCGKVMAFIEVNASRLSSKADKLAAAVGVPAVASGNVAAAPGGAAAPGSAIGAKVQSKGADKAL